MRNTLADPSVPVSTVPFWLGEGWVTRRRTNPGTGSGSTDTDTSGDGDDGGEGDSDDDDDADDGDGPDDGDGTVSKAEFERLKARMQGADKAKAAAEKKLQDLADKDKTDLQKAQDQVTNLTKERDQLHVENGAMKLENAFLKEATHSWKKPGSALRLAQADGYLDDVVGDDGKVDQKAFARKLKEFAKAYPELLKEDGAGESGNNGGTPPPSGGNVGNGGKGRKGQAGMSDEALQKKYSRVLR
jgi:hypothetical protein